MKRKFLSIWSLFFCAMVVNCTGTGDLSKEAVHPEKITSQKDPAVLNYELIHSVKINNLPNADVKIIKYPPESGQRLHVAVKFTKGQCNIYSKEKEDSGANMLILNPGGKEVYDALEILIYVEDGAVILLDNVGRVEIAPELFVSSIAFDLKSNQKLSANSVDNVLGRIGLDAVLTLQLVHNSLRIFSDGGRVDIHSLWAPYNSLLMNNNASINVKFFGPAAKVWYRDMDPAHASKHNLSDRCTEIDAAKADDHMQYIRGNMRSFLN